MSKKLAIIASDKCKLHDEGKKWWHLRRFVEAYAELLLKYDIVATDHTAEIVRSSLAAGKVGRRSRKKTVK